jgi:site-specific recombinase XerD
MDNPNLAMIAPTIVNRTVLRKPNAELRTREHLTLDEVEQLIETASANRQGHRDALMVLLAFRHGLRAGEIDFATATLHVRRIKNGTPATHPLTGREMRALRRHQRESARSAFVFVSERANAGHDTRALQAYLGHANIQNTTRYTALAQDRFKGFWRD